MKKLVCLLFALVLCLMSASVLAASSPSRTTEDLTQFEISCQDQPMAEGVYFRPVDESEVETQKIRLDDCHIEMGKLAASASLDAYFGDVLDMRPGKTKGKLVSLTEIVGTSTPNVFEFCPVIAGGFPPSIGDVTVTMLFPTPFEKDQHVIIMFGFVTLNADGTQHVAWRAFDGVGLGKGAVATADAGDSQVVFDDTGIGEDAVPVEKVGRVKVVLDPETMLTIENGIVLMAVVSK